MTRKLLFRQNDKSDVANEVEGGGALNGFGNIILWMFHERILKRMCVQICVTLQQRRRISLNYDYLEMSTSIVSLGMNDYRIYWDNLVKIEYKYMS